jgi:DNA-binding MarR family transcriptional regulator
MDKSDIGSYFRIFNEIGIIEQLSRSMFEARLPDGVLVSHFAVISHLVRVGDGPTPLRLARAFQVPKTTMTHTLGGLEKRGYVTITPNPEDKRSKCVWLTETGRLFRDEAIGALAPELAQISEVLSSEQADELLVHLERLRVYLDENRN